MKKIDGIPITATCEQCRKEINLLEPTWGFEYNAAQHRPMYFHDKCREKYVLSQFCDRYGR